MAAWAAAICCCWSWTAAKILCCWFWVWSWRFSLFWAASSAAIAIGLPPDVACNCCISAMDCKELPTFGFPLLRPVEAVGTSLLSSWRLLTAAPAPTTVGLASLITVELFVLSTSGDASVASVHKLAASTISTIIQKVQVIIIFIIILISFLHTW